jgi:hypothetical protein
VTAPKLARLVRYGADASENDTPTVRVCKPHTFFA